MVKAKKIKKINKRESGSEGYTQVLLENLNSKFDVFGESLDFVRDDVAVLKEDVSVLKEDVSVLTGELSLVKAKGDATFEEVGHLRQDIEFVKDELRLIRGGLKDKADREEVEALETRVVYLEKRFRAAP